MQIYLIPQNRTYRDDEDRKFYIMRILPQYK